MHTKLLGNFPVKRCVVEIRTVYTWLILLLHHSVATSSRILLGGGAEYFPPPPHCHTHPTHAAARSAGGECALMDATTDVAGGGAVPPRDVAGADAVLPPLKSGCQRAQ